MSERLFIQIDLARAERFDLNTSQAVLMGYIAGLITQKPQNVGNDDYYMADFTYIANDCCLLGKIDTVRRLFKQLEEKGLFRSLKMGGHTYITPCDDLRKWAQYKDSHFCNRAKKNPQEAEKNPQEAEKNPLSTLYNKSNNKSNNKKAQTLFASSSEPQEEKPRGTSDIKKCLFTESRYFDYEAFASCFDSAEFANVDISYYYNAVKDWSASSATKKTDWIATARNFMRSDNAKGKLVMRPKDIATELHHTLNDDGIIWD